jgi:hypothetical protein
MRRFDEGSPAMIDGQQDGASTILVLGAETRGVFGGLAPCRTRSPGFLTGVVAGCGAIERACRLRALAALVGALCRPRPSRLLASLRAAEGDDRALVDADDELASIPTLTQRRLISAWAACL